MHIFFSELPTVELPPGIRCPWRPPRRPGDRKEPSWDRKIRLHKEKERRELAQKIKIERLESFD